MKYGEKYQECIPDQGHYVREGGEVEGHLVKSLEHVFQVLIKVTC